MQLAAYGLSLSALPNGNLFHGTWGKLFLLNENFQEIKTVETGEESALSHKNEIYVILFKSLNYYIRFKFE